MLKIKHIKLSEKHFLLDNTHLLKTLQLLTPTKKRLGKYSSLFQKRLIAISSYFGPIQDFTELSQASFKQNKETFTQKL
jgi:hypothetical protein